MRMPLLLSVVLTAPCLLACQTPPEKADAEAKSDPAKADDVDDAAAAPDGGHAEAASNESLSNAERVAKGRDYAAGKGEEIFEVEPLTEEEQALVDADPATLSPEQKKARAYALRKKILQDPNSPQAQALKEAANQIVSGQVEPNLDYKQDGQSSAPPAE